MNLNLNKSYRDSMESPIFWHQRLYFHNARTLTKVWDNYLINRKRFFYLIFLEATQSKSIGLIWAFCGRTVTNKAWWGENLLTSSTRKQWARGKEQDPMIPSARHSSVLSIPSGGCTCLMVLLFPVGLWQGTFNAWPLGYSYSSITMLHPPNNTEFAPEIYALEKENLV